MSEDLNPIVSVIVASYNKSVYIDETINSVIQQSFVNWEMLVIDDFSTDNTREKVAAYSTDKRIRVIFLERNYGANFCRNLGIKEASGELILFLDADDLLDINCLANRVKFMLKEPSLDFSVFPMLVFKKQVGDSNYTWMPDSKKPLEDFLRHDLPWQTMQPIWRKKILLNLNGFDEQFKRLQDVEIHTRALLMPDIKYKLNTGAADCFYRIDEVRKNFEAFDFMERWLDSALRYCDKFADRVPQKKRNLLLGTIYSTYLQIIMHYRSGSLQKVEYKLLEDKLYGHFLVRESFVKKMIFRVSKIYNLRLPRVPGINKILKTAITA